MLYKQQIDINTNEVYMLYNTVINAKVGSGLLYENIKVSNHNLNDIYNDNWLKEYTEPTGGIVVRKNSDRQRIDPGDFHTWGSRKEFLQTGSLKEFAEWIYPAWVIEKGDGNIDQSIWVKLNGKRLLNIEPKRINRFYFNLLPHKQRILSFVDNLSDRLNFCQIPFQFKCLNNLEDYKRSDSAVLYIQKNHFNSVILIIGELYQSYTDIMRSETPIFTYSIANGVGFGENPPGEGESFGSYRARLICEAIQKIDKQGKDLIDDYIINEIENYLLELGFDENRFYLNSRSPDGYNFSLFFNHTDLRNSFKTAYSNTDSIQKLSFKYAEKIAFELCKEAIWINHSACTWATITNSFDNIYKLINTDELKEVNEYLNIINHLNGKVESIIKHTISGCNTMIYKNSHNYFYISNTLIPLISDETLFTSIKKYVSNSLPIDRNALYLAEKLINILLANDTLPINGFGNDYFCPTASNGIIMYGNFLLKISETNEIKNIV